MIGTLGAMKAVMRLGRTRLSAVLICAVLAFASLSACATEKPSNDFCTAFKTATTQLQDSKNWVDASGKVDVMRATIGMVGLIDTLTKLTENAPPDVKAELDKVVPVYNELRDAVMSGDMNRIQTAAAKLSDPALQAALTNALQKAATACS